MGEFRPKSHQKGFYDAFRRLCHTRHDWEAWADFISMFASAISNAADATQAPAREERYLQTISRYQPEEQALFPRLMAETVMALEENPDQDFLGDLYMGLNLGNHWKGQFFTPYNVCRMMASMTTAGAGQRTAEHGWTTVCDPACGAGATLIAAANELQRQGVNYQERVLFAGQDLDPVAAGMCYIQLSLLGCPGYIAVGNTLTTPMTGIPLFPHSREGLDIWCTPMFFSPVWSWRRAFALAEKKTGREALKA